MFTKEYYSLWEKNELYLFHQLLKQLISIENTNMHRQQDVAYILKQDVVIKLNNAVTRFIYKEKQHGWIRYTILIFWNLDAYQFV